MTEVGAKNVGDTNLDEGMKFLEKLGSFMLELCHERKSLGI